MTKVLPSRWDLEEDLAAAQKEIVNLERENRELRRANTAQVAALRRVKVLIEDAQKKLGVLARWQKRE